MIVALLLAAGMGRRFGGGKLTVRVDGTPLVRLTAESLLRTSADRVLVVVGHDATSVRAALSGLAVDIVAAEEYARGMSASLRAGLRALPAGATHVLVTLADQPGAAAPEVVEPVLRAVREGSRPIVAARFLDRVGPPVAFPLALLDELMALQGDAGARAVVERDPSRVHEVPLPFASPVDVDTPDDLAALAALARSPSPRERRDG